MNMRWVLLAISVVIFVGPIGAALVIHRDNLAALVMPETPEFMTATPDIKYEGYQVIDPTKPPLLKFKITNPYNINLKFNSVSAEVFCSDHNTPLGFANETARLSIPAKSHAILSLALTYTSQGEAHISSNHLGQSKLKMDLRNLAVDIQGIILHFKGKISIGEPIPITP